MRASIPDLDGNETPLANLALVVLPYDRDSILHSLEARAPTPRPHVRELDSLFAAWREPFARFAALSYRTHDLEDSLARIRSRLDSLPRNAPEYQTWYRRFGALNDSLDRLQRAAEPVRRELDRLRRTVVPRIDSLRREVTRWENSTFQGYESLAGLFTRTANPAADTTGPLGTATITVRPGRWWVYAWTWDPEDPYRRWYWNVPVGEDTVFLNAQTGQRKPRY